MEHQEKDANEDEKSVRGAVSALKDKFIPGIKLGLLLSTIFNLAMLVVGCVHVHDCPVNNKIPLFLIAIGAIGLASKFVSYIRDRVLKKADVTYMESILYGTETIFFCLGTYWIYKEFQPSYNPADANYCNKTTYMFGFVYITVYFAIAIAILIGLCCFITCVAALAKYTCTKIQETVEENENEEEKVPVQV